jgi:hypothetical protein
MAMMKSFATFEDWLDAQRAPQQKIVAPLRKLATRVSKKLVETAKWGNGCWELDGLPIAFVHAEKDHIQFGFFGGALLSDPQRVLSGSAKYVRSKKLYSPDDIDSAALARLFKQALKVKYR